jgi:hypothetical protein
VTEKSQAVVATIIGAVLGGVAGYLFFTEPGRQLRRELEPALGNLANELNSFRVTVDKAVGVANEGWKVLHEAMDSAERRYPSVHQSSPF